MLTISTGLRYVTLALLTAYGLIAQTDGPVTGFLQIKGQKVEIKHGYAQLIRSRDHPEEESVECWFSDQPLTPEMLHHPSMIRDAVYGDEMSALRLEIENEGKLISGTIESKKLGHAYLLAISDSSLRLRVVAHRVKGSYVTNAATFWASDDIQVNFSFDLQVLPRFTEPEPLAADIAAATKLPCAQAYLALRKALFEKNLSAFKELVTPEAAAKLNVPEAPKILDMLALLAPKKIRIVNAVETNGKTTLTVVSDDPAVKLRGKVTMIQQSGKWVMAHQFWGLTDE